MLLQRRNAPRQPAKLSALRSRCHDRRPFEGHFVARLKQFARKRARTPRRLTPLAPTHGGWPQSCIAPVAWLAYHRSTVPQVPGLATLISKRVQHLGPATLISKRAQHLGPATLTSRRAQHFGPAVPAAPPIRSSRSDPRSVWPTQVQLSAPYASVTVQQAGQQRPSLPFTTMPQPGVPCGSACLPGLSPRLSTR